jgi:nicotinamidase-related amidase
MSTGNIWDAFVSERDRQIMQLAGYGARMGFGERPALVIVDATYGFCGDKPEPILESIKRWPNSCGEEAWAALEQIQRLAAAFRAQGRPVIYTRGDYREDKWNMGSWLWKHARSRPEPAPPSRQDGKHHDDIVEKIAPHASDIVIGKLKPSAFFETPLRSYLTLLGVDTLVLTGGSTSGCVRATAVDGFSANYRIAVAADACFDRVQSSHAVTLMDLHAKYADVVTADEVLRHFS